MKILGITAEYNPFHNGHVYNMQEARKRTDADCCIVAMSGNFTQRGEPAVADKWMRARQAVEEGGKTGRGADLVVELPVAFACNTAKHFAAGGVDSLVKMGANCIAFGCETQEPVLLYDLALKMIKDREPLEQRTLEAMKKGYSRAKAYYTAVEQLIGHTSAELMRLPNNILAIEYYKRIAYWKEIGVDIEDVPIVRHGSNHDGIEDMRSGSGFAGASQIRKMISEKKDISRFVPSETHYERIENIVYRQFIMLKAIIVRSRPDELAEIYGVGEGLHHKMKIEISDSYSMDEFVKRLVSRRYTEAAIRRILTHVLLGFRKKEVDDVISEGITYCRVLATGKEGRSLIRKIKAEKFDIITNINKEKPATEIGAKSQEMSVHAADVYNMLCGKDMYAFSDRVLRPYIAV